jgi:hypothetical protein
MSMDGPAIRIENLSTICQPNSLKKHHAVIVAGVIRTILLGLVALSLANCSSILSGTVSAVHYNGPPQPPEFTVLSQDPLSLTDRNISARIEAKMSERGYRKAMSPETANVGVLYKYSIDPLGNVQNIPDFPIYTTYPRRFMIAVIDLRKSKLPDKPEFLWQGEVYSLGESTNLSVLAPDFIDVLFEYFGTTISNKEFSKRIEPK